MRDRNTESALKSRNPTQYNQDPEQQRTPGLSTAHDHAADRKGLFPSSAAFPNCDLHREGQGATSARTEVKVSFNFLNMPAQQNEAKSQK